MLELINTTSSDINNGPFLDRTVGRSERKEKLIARSKMQTKAFPSIKCKQSMVVVTNTGEKDSNI